MRYLELSRPRALGAMVVTVAGEGGAEGIRSWGLVGAQFLFCKMERVLRGPLRGTAGVPNTTGLHVSKGRGGKFCYVYFKSLFFLRGTWGREGADDRPRTL